MGDGLEPTATWQRALTPSYASPEQIRGQRTTTASDVYSLGVVLYQLLTGSLPFDFTGRSPSEIERLVTETEPTRPSLAVRRVSRVTTDDPGLPADRLALETSKNLGQTLAGDLDAIVLKALRSVPRDRYGSVEQLAADIDRYLEGLPVVARQGTWRYRAAKFLRRNRTAVITSSLIAILLVSFALSMSWQAAKTIRERDQARIERDMKNQVASVVREIFTLSNPYVVPGAELTVREAVERSVPLLEVRLADQPAVRAELLHTSAAILGAVGQHQVAESQLREALRLRQELLAEGHPDLAATMDLLAYELATLGNLDEAESLARTVLEWARGSADPDGAGVVDPLIRLASVLCFRAEFEGAEHVALEALSLARSLPASELQVILSHEYLGVVESARGAYEKAVEHQRTAVAGLRLLHGANHPLLVDPLSNLGLSQRRSGDLAGSVVTYEELIALQRFNFGEDFTDANTTVNLAGLQIALGDYQIAEDLYVQALEELGGPDSKHPAKLHTELALANARVLGGKPVEAEADLRRIIARVRSKRGDDYWRIAQAESILGASLGVQGRNAEAEPLLIGGFERIVGASRERYERDAFDRLRRYLEAQGRAEEVAAFEAKLAHD
jgi:serine/threonine-protein kinase